jgi:uncharacterized membrane protein
MDLSDLNGWLKVVHVVAAAVWVGGSVLVQVYGARQRQAGDEDRIRFANDTLVAGNVFAAAGIVTLAAGVWLVLRVDGWGFDQAWISIGFVGVLIGAVLGMAFYAPQTRALIGELEAGSPAAGPRARRIAIISTIETVILVVVVWAMVFKPGL